MLINHTASLPAFLSPDLDCPSWWLAAPCQCSRGDRNISELHSLELRSFAGHNNSQHDQHSSSSEPVSSCKPSAARNAPARQAAESTSNSTVLPATDRNSALQQSAFMLIMGQPALAKDAEPVLLVIADSSTAK